MKKKYLPLAGVVLGLLLGTSGCNLPTRTDQQISPQAVYTQAAETIIAQLTAQSTAQDTEQPTAISGPAETALTATGTATLLATTQPAPTETQAPIVTPSPSEAASSTPTATEIPPTQSSDPKLALGDPEWRDNFSSGRNWSLYEDDHVQFEIEDGGLRMRALEPEGFDAWMITWPKPQDYYLEMAALTQECSELDRYGVIFRSDASEGYLFGFSCDGRYSLRSWDGEEFTDLVDWTSSPHILSGAGLTNRMGVWIEGGNIALYANGVLLDEVNDQTYSEGRFGVFVASENTEDFDVLVEEMAYWELQ